MIILLDEYDTPMQEAYVSGYWAELVPLIRSLFHSSFFLIPENTALIGQTQAPTAL